MDLICGSYFKHQCRHQFTDYRSESSCFFNYKEDKSIENNLVFCRPEFLRDLHKTDIVKDEFVLVTHNSDINFTEALAQEVLTALPKMTHWYTQNLMTANEKISPIPIGIANPKWPHGNTDTFEKVMSESNEKDNLVYVNFNYLTNPKERLYCFEQLGMKPIIYPKPYELETYKVFLTETLEGYLRDVSKSRFIVSPDGNGKDCHKVWESLLMRAIPIVTDSFFARRFRQMGVPILIINDWNEFESLELSEDLYNEMWSGFDPSILTFDFFK